MTTLRDQLIKFQKRSYNYNLKQINQSLKLDKNIIKYSNEYNRYTKNFESISTFDELIKSILASNIVYQGDYHTLIESQKSVLDILNEIIPKKQIILCLEMFHACDQSLINEYMNNNISEITFLKKINYIEKWGYDWTYWKKIIDKCKTNKVKVIGINKEFLDCKNTLIKRDIFSAITIGKIMISNPYALIYVVDGDYHICPSHLPHEVEKKLKVFDITPIKTIIYQNPSPLYWKLAETNNEDKDILKINNFSYCIINTTPPNKLQSYINWLELAENSFYPINKILVDTPFINPLISITKIIKNICSLIDVPFPEAAVESLSVYNSKDLNFMNIVQDTKELRSMLPKIRKKIKNNEGFLIPFNKNGQSNYMIYLANSSYAIACEEAMHLIHIVYREKIKYSTLTAFDKFYLNIITECIGFYGSKLLVPKRSSNSIPSLNKFIKNNINAKPNSLNGKNVSIANQIVKHLKLSKKSKNYKDFQKTFPSLYKKYSYMPQLISTQIGYFLGNKMFLAIKKGRFTNDSFKSLLKQNFQKPYEAFDMHIKLFNEL